MRVAAIISSGRPGAADPIRSRKVRMRADAIETAEQQIATLQQ
jgi:hypothetical protein